MSAGDFWPIYFTPILSFIEVILIGVYVYFTIKTFKQIKKQTDLQLQAFLFVEEKVLTKSQLAEISNKIEFPEELSKQWKNSLTRIFQRTIEFNEVFDEHEFYCLTFTNYSSTEVKKVILECEIEIQNYPNVTEEQKLIPSERKKFCHELDKIIQRGDPVTIVLVKTNWFPKYTIRTRGQYIDIREQSCKYSCNGKSGENSEFQLAPRKE